MFRVDNSVRVKLCQAFYCARTKHRERQTEREKNRTGIDNEKDKDNQANNKGKRKI